MYGQGNLYLGNFSGPSCRPQQFLSFLPGIEFPLWARCIHRNIPLSVLSFLLRLRGTLGMIVDLLDWAVHITSTTWSQNLRAPFLGSVSRETELLVLSELLSSLWQRNPHPKDHLYGMLGVYWASWSLPVLTCKLSYCGQHHTLLLFSAAGLTHEEPRVSTERILNFSFLCECMWCEKNLT